MAYLIPIVLLLLIVTGFVTYFVLNATRKSNPAEISTPDPSPLGDTTEHAESADGVGDGDDGGDGHEDAAHPGEGEGSRAVPPPESERLGNRS